MKSWSDARAYCLAKGGDLASLRGKEDNDKVEALLNKHMIDPGLWIGANDRSKEGHFEWSDGSPFSYTNWQSGRPMNSEGNDCVMLPDWNPKMKWSMNPCNNKFGFICKLPV